MGDARPLIALASWLVAGAAFATGASPVWIVLVLVLTAAVIADLVRAGSRVSPAWIAATFVAGPAGYVGFVIARAAALTPPERRRRSTTAHVRLVVVGALLGVIGVWLPDVAGPLAAAADRPNPVTNGFLLLFGVLPAAVAVLAAVRARRRLRE